MSDDWVIVSKKINKKYRTCSLCEITKIIYNNKSSDYKKVSIINNIILNSILDQIGKYLYVSGYLEEERKFIITPDNDKYEIKVMEICKNCVILKQSHLHTDKEQKDGLKRHSYRYVKITW